MTVSAEKPLTGRGVLIWLIGFFGVIFAVNIFFAYVALDTWSGLESKDAYSAGLGFNKTLDARQEQRSRGWESAVRTIPNADGSHQLLAEFKDKSGTPLSRLTVVADVIRPTHAGYDMNLEMRAVGNGVYRADLELPLDGIWDVHLNAENFGAEEFYGKTRIYVER